MFSGRDLTEICDVKTIYLAGISGNVEWKIAAPAPSVKKLTGIGHEIFYTLRINKPVLYREV